MSGETFNSGERDLAYSPAERLKKLSQLERFLSKNDGPAMLPAAVGLAEIYAARMVRFERAAGRQLEAQWLVRGEKGLKGGSFPLSGAVSQAVWREGRLYNCDDARKRFQQDSFVQEYKTDCYFGLPLPDGKGKVRLVLSFLGDTPFAFSGEEIRSVMGVVERIIAKAAPPPSPSEGETEGLRRRNRELELLNAVTAAAGEVLDNPAQLEEALATIVERFAASAGLVFLWEEAARKLAYFAGSNPRFKEALGGESREFASFKSALECLREGAWGDLDLKKLFGGEYWQAVPLEINEKKSGILLLAAGQAVRGEPLSVLAPAARQLTFAVERLAHFQREKRRLVQLETLSQVATRIAGFLSLDELLPYVVGLLHDHFRYYQVHIFLLDEERDELVVMAGKGEYRGAKSTVGQRLAIGRGINGMVARTGKSLLVNDVTKEPAFHFVKELPDTRSELTVPIKAEGKVLGTLDIQSSQPDAFWPADVLTLQTVADQVGIAVTNARLFEKSRKQNLRLSILNRLSSEIASARERKEVLELILESARKLLSSGHALLLVSAPNGLALFEYRLSPEESRTARRLVQELSRAQEFLRGCIEAGECRYYDLARLEGWPSAVGDCLGRLGFSRFFCAPLRARGGKLLAFLLISAENTHESPDNFLRLVQAFAYQAQTALENAFLIQELIESEAKFTDLYENAPDMYQTLDSTGRVLACNRTQEKVLGVPKKEILGRPFSDWVHPDSKGAWEEHVRTVSGSAEESSCHVHLVLAGGGVMDAEAHSRRVVSREGGILIRSVLRDVTEKKKLEQQLLQSQKMESIGTLAAGVAHEFNNFLGGIVGYADLALRIGQPEKMTKNLGEIIRISQEAKEVVRQLLSFSKKVGEGTWLPVDLEKVMREAADLVARELHRQAIQLEWRLEKTPPLMGQHEQLVQVFLNLFINAVHAIGQGGKIAVRMAPLGESIRVEVADNGSGITPENLPKIFDPFFSTKGVYGDGSQPGTGLGLTICYNVVRAHGGEITVASEVGAGTTFTLTFPLPRKAPVSPPTRSAVP
ncbi:MAG TPA: GAF domain-containing protein [Verrucomicrobiae bacterium]|nr:GAF domain-containing protein [Verrucomicrobiae bacterium]